MRKEVITITPIQLFMLGIELGIGSYFLAKKNKE